jgi:hypothetical protein
LVSVRFSSDVSNPSLGLMLPLSFVPSPPAKVHSFKMPTFMKVETPVHDSFYKGIGNLGVQRAWSEIMNV